MLPVLMAGLGAAKTITSYQGGVRDAAKGVKGAKNAYQNYVNNIKKNVKRNIHRDFKDTVEGEPDEFIQLEDTAPLQIPEITSNDDAAILKGLVSPKLLTEGEKTRSDEIHGVLRLGNSKRALKKVIDIITRNPKARAGLSTDLIVAGMREQFPAANEELDNMMDQAETILSKQDDGKLKDPDVIRDAPKKTGASLEEIEEAKEKEEIEPIKETAQDLFDEDRVLEPPAELSEEELEGEPSEPRDPEDYIDEPEYFEPDERMIEHFEDLDDVPGDKPPTQHLEEVKDEGFEEPAEDIEDIGQEVDFSELILGTPKKETPADIAPGEVVEYNGSPYILWNINKSGKAQLINW